MPFIDFETSGAMILANGAQFHIKGVNWFGFESKDGVLARVDGEPDGEPDLSDTLCRVNVRVVYIIAAR